MKQPDLRHLVCKWRSERGADVLQGGLMLVTKRLKRRWCDVNYKLINDKGYLSAMILLWINMRVSNSASRVWYFLGLALSQ